MSTAEASPQTSALGFARSAPGSSLFRPPSPALLSQRRRYHRTPTCFSYFVPLPPPPPPPELALRLRVLQPLDTFSASSPSVGRRRAFQPGGHNAAIPTNRWQINQCYLFFPCLYRHRFFFLHPPPSFRYFAVCGDLNFAQLN